MLVMMSLVVIMLGLVRSGWFANLRECFLQRRHIGFVGIVGDGHRLCFHIKHQVFHAILQFLVIRNVFQNLLAAVLAMQVNIQHHFLFVWFCLGCTQHIGIGNIASKKIIIRFICVLCSIVCRCVVLCRVVTR